MNWNNYFKALENAYRIKLDSAIRNTIIANFSQDMNLYTEQDMYEQSQKLIQSYKYSKMNYNKNNY